MLSNWRTVYGNSVVNWAGLSVLIGLIAIAIAIAGVPWGIWILLGLALLLLIANN